MDLGQIEQRFVLHWGEMGSRWGINRTVAQIHALLYISDDALDAEEISSTLGVARSNVSTSLKELLGWRIVKISHIIGDRRDHFESLTDPWELFEVILEERKRREIDPTVELVAQCIAEARESKTMSPTALHRLEELNNFIQDMVTLYEDTSKLSRKSRQRLVKMGKKLHKILGLK